MPRAALLRASAETREQYAGKEIPSRHKSGGRNEDDPARTTVVLVSAYFFSPERQPGRCGRRESPSGCVCRRTPDEARGPLREAALILSPASTQPRRRGAYETGPEEDGESRGAPVLLRGHFRPSSASVISSGRPRKSCWTKVISTRLALGSSMISRSP